MRRAVDRLLVVIGVLGLVVLVLLLVTLWKWLTYGGWVWA